MILHTLTYCRVCGKRSSHGPHSNRGNNEKNTCKHFIGGFRLLDYYNICRVYGQHNRLLKGVWGIVRRDWKTTGAQHRGCCQGRRRRRKHNILYVHQDDQRQACTTQRNTQSIPKCASPFAVTLIPFLERGKEAEIAIVTASRPG
jgi:hypothetical protein